MLEEIVHGRVTFGLLLGQVTVDFLVNVVPVLGLLIARRICGLLRLCHDGKGTLLKACPIEIGGLFQFDLDLLALEVSGALCRIDFVPEVYERQHFSRAAVLETNLFLSDVHFDLRLRISLALC